MTTLLSNGCPNLYPSNIITVRSRMRLVGQIDRTILWDVHAVLELLDVGWKHPSGDPTVYIRIKVKQALITTETRWKVLRLAPSSGSFSFSVWKTLMILWRAEKLQDLEECFCFMESEMLKSVLANGHGPPNFPRNLLPPFSKLKTEHRFRSENWCLSIKLLDVISQKAVVFIHIPLKTSNLITFEIRI
jgi:hypothetical protein